MFNNGIQGVNAPYLKGRGLLSQEVDATILDYFNDALIIILFYYNVN